MLRFTAFTRARATPQWSAWNITKAKYKAAVAQAARLGFKGDERMAFLCAKYVGKHTTAPAEAEPNVFSHPWATRNILNVGTDEDDVSRMEKYPLHVAAERGAVGVVKLLLAHPSCKKNAKDDFGRTALHDASEYGHTECVRALLAAGAGITVTDDAGETALHLAALAGHVAAVRLLAAHRDFAKIRDARSGNGWTALHKASEFGYSDCVRELLAAGAGITVGNSGSLRPSDGTALHFAAIQGKTDLIRLLAAHRDFAKIRDARSGNGRTALHSASYFGRTESVRELLAVGADITLADVDGRTALHCAAMRGWRPDSNNGYVDTVRLLAAHRDFAKIRGKRDVDGKTALGLANKEEIKQVLRIKKCQKHKRGTNKKTFKPAKRNNKT